MSSGTERFDTALQHAARDVERHLAARLQPGDGPARRVVDAMRHAALGGGKRLRPFLVIESTRLAGGRPGNALQVAAALECIHCYSLVHDDLPAMDDDDLRRGQPTVHRAYDEATAILAGDGLLTLAFELVAEDATHDDPAVRVALVAALARAAGTHGMVGGQMLDLQGGETLRTVDDIIAMQRLKTGALIEFACRAGPMLAGAGPDVADALGRYAENIGLAFQIADDLLDAEGTAETVGKTTGKDADAGKATFVGLLGAPGARAMAQDLVDTAVTALAPFGDDAGVLREAARFIVTRQN